MHSVHTLEALVQRLNSFEESQIALEPVQEILSKAVIDEESLLPFLHFRPDKYTRNLVHRSRLFDVLVLCWRPGQMTPVHNHRGNLGWVRVLRGRIKETCYDLRVLATPGEEVEPEGLERARKLALVETGTTILPAGNAVATVDAVHGIHQLGNPESSSGGEVTVTLHVYSRPHDSCMIYDLESGSSRRMNLSFDTQPQDLKL